MIEEEFDEEVIMLKAEGFMRQSLDLLRGVDFL